MDVVSTVTKVNEVIEKGNNIMGDGVNSILDIKDTFTDLFNKKKGEEDKVKLSKEEIEEIEKMNLGEVERRKVMKEKLEEKIKEIEKQKRIEEEAKKPLNFTNFLSMNYEMEELEVEEETVFELYSSNTKEDDLKLMLIDFEPDQNQLKTLEITDEYNKGIFF
jgi:hypothetical protein